MAKPQPTVGEIISNVGAANKIADANAKLAKGVPSNASVAQGGFVGPDGNYTTERQAIHGQILASIFTDSAVVNAMPPAGEKPTLSVLGGRGGSGKSFITGPGGPVNASNAILLDSDKIKAALPGYEGWNAGLLHEEATHILQQADKRATAIGVNVIHDATMRSIASVSSRIATYEGAGYDVNGYYVFAPPAVATERALARFVRGGSTGRYVPPDVIMSNTNNETNFDTLKNGFSKWQVYDNSGTSPKLVASGGK